MNPLCCYSYQNREKVCPVDDMLCTNYAPEERTDVEVRTVATGWKNKKDKVIVKVSSFVRRRNKGAVRLGGKPCYLKAVHLNLKG